MKPLWLIVAYAVPSRVIGLNGRMPWHYPADLRHFKNITLGHPVIMGRATWDSLGRPLPGRQNLVLSRSSSTQAPGAQVVANLESALDACQGDLAPVIIGGAHVYAQALAMNLVSHLYLTEIAVDTPGDTFFPAIPDGFRETSRRIDGPLTFIEMARQGDSSDNSGKT